MHSIRGGGADDCLWYEARELMEPDEDWDTKSEIDPLEALLESNLQRLRRPSAGDPSRFPRRRFKPIHRADGTLEMPIFRGHTSGEKIYQVNNTLVSNSKFAETILKIQLRMASLKERANNLNARLRQVREVNEARDGDEDDDASPAAAFWHLITSLFKARFFWFAWPILLLTILNRYWPLNTIKCFGR